MNEDSDRPLPPIVVPHTDLSPDALEGVIQSFVLREGTDYGAHETSLEVKVAQVLRQVHRGVAPHRATALRTLRRPDGLARTTLR